MSVCGVHVCVGRSRIVALVLRHATASHTIWPVELDCELLAGAAAEAGSLVGAGAPVVPTPRDADEVPCIHVD
jgi:hypothetical protein